MKELRAECNISSMKLTEYTCISNSVITYLENEKRQFRQNHLEKLTYFFQVTVDYLLGKGDYGIVVEDKFGQEITLTESEYLTLKDKIRVEIVHENTEEDLLIFAPREVTFKKDGTMAVDYFMTQYRVKRTLFTDEEVISKRNLLSKYTEYGNKMTSEQIAKAIKFIEEYIL